MNVICTKNILNIILYFQYTYEFINISQKILIKPNSKVTRGNQSIILLIVSLLDQLNV